MMKSLKINQQLAEALPDHEIDEITQLRKNLQSDGRCFDPIILWNGTIIDGHRRYALCTELEIQYQTVEVGHDFESIEEARLWVAEHQAGRRNLTQDQLAMHVATARKLVPAPVGRPSKNSENIGEKIADKSAIKVAEVAKDTGIDRRVLGQAAHVNVSGSEELKSAVSKGKVTLKTATEIAKKPKSRQSAAIRVARTPKPPKPKKPAEKDQVGTPIPDHLKEAFAARAVLDEALTKLTAISTLTNPLIGDAQANVKGKPGGEQLQADRDRLRKAINELRTVLSFARPYAVCPRHDDKKRCLVCGGNGWVVEHGYKTAGIK